MTATRGQGLYGNFNYGLVEEDLSDFLISLGASGKLGEEGEPDPLGVKGIYQMRMTKRGKRSIKMKFYRPTNPQTTAQEDNRTKFANAMAGWGALTDTEKSAYNERAKKLNLFGWNLYIREFFNNN